MELTKLRTLHMTNPLGIDEKPYFSWILLSDRQNVFQTGWRIRVRDSKGRLCWDSGFRQEEENTFIPYEGISLESRMKYAWEVYVENNYGESAVAAAEFETAILKENEWEAVWVESGLLAGRREAGFGNQPPASMFRRCFAVQDQKEIAQARIYCTAKGVYCLYVNGLRPDERELAPGYASYDHIHPYQTYDVTAHFAVDAYALKEYDGTPLYEYSNRDVGESEWGSCNFIHSRGEVVSSCNHRRITGCRSIILTDCAWTPSAG